MDKNHDDVENTRLRWCIGAARYAVAALVTAITVAVIVRAVDVSLRSEKLYIKVGNGNVTVVDISTSPNKVKLSVTLLSYNPSGRVGINYRGVNISLLHHNGALITWFVIKDDINSIMVGPGDVQLVHVSATQKVPEDVSQEFVDRMRNGTRVTDATVHLNGTLRTQISGFNYTRGHTTKFRCYPITIGRVPANLVAAADDVSCNEVF
ncbi:unnamed protein product [Alopecurus aequalis]